MTAHRRFATSVLFAATAIVVGCSSGESNGAGGGCLPGQSVACVGPGGCAGGQACREDGKSFEPCVCGGPDAQTGEDGSLIPDDAAGDGTVVADAYDAGGSADSGLPDTAACSTGSVVAVKAPADVILAIDQSGSMSDDIANVKSSINKLSDSLSKSGLDYRVVMIAGYDGASIDGQGVLRATSTSYQVCVPPPLGATTCGAPAAKFRQANVNVQSYDALKIIAQTYDSTAVGVQWADFLRPTAIKVIIPITDDDSVPGTGAYYGVSADDFDTRMTSKPGEPFGTTARRKYVVHPVIGAPAHPMETPKCGTNAVNTGPQYITLAKLTGGKCPSV